MRLINADALLEDLRIHEDCDVCPRYENGCKGHLQWLCKRIKNAPTVEIVKYGKWEKISDRNYKCTCCSAWWAVDRDSTMKDFAFCPSCGAKMFAKDIDVPNKEGAKNETN